MESAGLVLDALGRVREMVRGALKDLSPQELLSPPKPHSAWLVWHLSRVQDVNVSGLMERPDGNNVSVERESLLLAEAQMKFNVGVQLLRQQFRIISLAINSGGTTS